ncbi:MAG: hypothetical protein K5798_01980 [Nitrosopumilus sp.]|uniref:hypothetical protein n=1 Tax=Nitrosopumilus sp. TaxID=2024843 RepID=UPI00242ACFF0|nr:hypothetical protein [Nitrosopumilus sp.]MCV0366018.1 hypothetical protein [Nitrosopumilus sp.]
MNQTKYLLAAVIAVATMSIAFDAMLFNNTWVFDEPTIFINADLEECKDDAEMERLSCVAIKSGMHRPGAYFKCYGMDDPDGCFEKLDNQINDQLDMCQTEYDESTTSCEAMFG